MSLRVYLDFLKSHWLTGTKWHLDNKYFKWLQIRSLQKYGQLKKIFFLQEFSFKILILRQCQHRGIILNT